MLSYQHAYHAGNHADILKHYILYSVIQALNKKDKPYAFYDSHAGSGLYDILDNRSLKTGESQEGIIKLLSFLKGEGAALREELPQNFKNYLELAAAFLEKNLYPGSPLIEARLLRPGDRLILSELHPYEYESLKNNMAAEKKDCQLQLHKRSGWEMLKALTPPSEKRGAVLIDPSYEEVKDYQSAAQTICQLYKKWSNGIIMLWYPLLAHRALEIENMLAEIKNYVHSLNANTSVDDLRLCVNDKNAHKEVSLQEALTDKKNPPRLYGSGMLIINTPWKLYEEACQSIKICEQVFYPSKKLR